MGRIFLNTVNEAQVQAIVQAELVSNPPSSQLPTYATPPSGYSNGQVYTNSTDGKMYMMTSSGFKEMDVKDGTEFQDLSGNTVLID